MVNNYPIYGLWNHETIVLVDDDPRTACECCFGLFVGRRQSTQLVKPVRPCFPRRACPMKNKIRRLRVREADFCAGSAPVRCPCRDKWPFHRRHTYVGSRTGNATVDRISQTTQARLGEETTRLRGGPAVKCRWKLTFRKWK